MSYKTERTSYKINNFSTNVEVEIKRLKAQVALFCDKEFEIYRRFGLTDGMHILECGSGPGFVMEKIMTSLPVCHIVGIEIDPYLIGISGKYLKEKNFSRFEIVEDSIMDLRFPDNYFDYAIARLVLEHVTEFLAKCRYRY